MAKKASFIVYYDWEDELQDLTDEQVGQLFRALFAHEKRGEAYSGDDSAVLLAFRFLSRAMDRNRAKYEEICLKRSAAGKKGGAPAGNQNARKAAPPPENKQNKQKQTKQTKQPDSDSEPVPVPVPVPDKDSEPVPDSEKDRSGAAVSTVTVLTFFQNLLGKNLTAGCKTAISRYCEEMGCEKVLEAMKIAERNGVIGWKYCEGILNNWKKEEESHANSGGPDAGSPPALRWAGRWDGDIL